MTPRTPLPAASSRGKKGFRSLVELRLHGPSLALFVVWSALAVAAFLWLQSRARERQRAAFDAEASSVASTLRSALERPLEILEATGAFFEASHQVSRAEFARFVQPALLRHPGVRALAWVPIVPGSERARYETAARADGLVGFEFREHAVSGGMVTAEKRAEHLPVYFMEPGHPLVLGFDCASDPERLDVIERARLSGASVASERVRLLDDPASVYSVIAFRPVIDVRRPRSADRVLGFVCEVFRPRAVAEGAIEESVRRGIQVSLLDPAAAPGKRLLFESVEGLSQQPLPSLRLRASLRYADRDWRLLLSAAPDYRKEFGEPTWFALLAGIATGALAGLTLSAVRIIRRSRRQA